MRLTSYTDYALRTLMYLALNRERLATIGDIAQAHGIPKNHLTKVVHQLGLLGFVTTVRGRSGGLRLGREPAAILIGDVVRRTETDFYMASCFDAAAPSCLYAGACAMHGALAEATAAFLGVLDKLTLEQMVARSRQAGAQAGMQPAPLVFRPAAVEA